MVAPDRLLITFIHRRTRSGTTLWVYGVTLVIAETIRRIVLWQLDATAAADTISFVAIIFGVIAAVDGAATLRRHHSIRRRPTPSRAVADAPDRP
jgi:hypothetical protein